MINHFDKKLKEILSEEIDSSDIFNLIFEDNYFLKVPQQIFTMVEKTILSLIKNNDFDTYKEIFIKDLIYELSEEKYYNELVKLFKNSSNKILIKISKNFLKINSNSIKGSFTVHGWFGINTNEFSLNHINVLSDIQSPQIRKLIKEKINDKIDAKKKHYKDIQRNLEIFKKDISKIEHLAKLEIFPEACTLNENDLDKPTLHEAIEHEVQHLCIFLLSVAKTYAYFGKHFSNVNWTCQYQLSEHEFITLLGSYTNILIRIFKSVNSNKENLNIFIHTCLEAFLKDTNIYDNNYKKVLLSSKMFNDIKKFYQDIFNDRRFVLNVNNEQITEIYENKKKFKLLLKWTYKNLYKNLSN